MQFNYDNNKISYIIATQEYIYTIDNYNDLRQQAEQYDFERYSICDGIVMNQLLIYQMLIQDDVFP